VLAAHERGERLLLRTSGTTASSRAVVRSTESWVRSFPHVSRLLGVGDGSAVWVPGPLTATMNLFATVHACWAGASVVDSPEAATHAHLTPAALSRALATGTDLAGVHVTVAGDALGRTLHDRAVTAGCRVSHYYGAAELSFVAWGSHHEDLQPFPEVEVTSRAGILWVRSPYLADGYAGPAESPGPLNRDETGFVTLGDRGEVAEGLVRVHGRGDDAVTTAGATVRVTDVERALAPELNGEVVVLGLPHPDLGAVLVAVLTRQADLTRAREVARARLSGAQRPRRWYVVPALPLSSAGKVDRTALAGRLVSPDVGVRPSG
jgi:long-chain acyl-CoA synthetase